jgi:hypothetical protein
VFKDQPPSLIISDVNAITPSPTSFVAIRHRLPSTATDCPAFADAYFRKFRALIKNAGFKAVQSTPLIAHGNLLGNVSTHGQRNPSKPKLGMIRQEANQTVDKIYWIRAKI